MGNILFVGIDVDDKSFHGCGVLLGAGYEKEFKVSPTTAALTKKLLDWKREFGASEVRVVTRRVTLALVCKGR